jgi:glycolate oxidase iron-sulfur subunit
MKTALADFIRDTPAGREADAILRSCVHCGFCLPACPTYQLLGDELDSPRGRIYLMKQVLEGQPVTASTQLHLDRCLGCRACESACPSGVQYGRLLELGRAVTDAHVPRAALPATQRYLLRKIVPHARRAGALLGGGAERCGRRCRGRLSGPAAGTAGAGDGRGPGVAGRTPRAPRRRSPLALAADARRGHQSGRRSCARPARDLRSACPRGRLLWRGDAAPER